MSGLHLLGSSVVLSIVLGVLYLGWYRWPGWYLTGALPIIATLAGVDLALGPLLTLIVAGPNKPRRELTRDIGIILAVQLCALVYGASSLWHGRPLFYAFSETLLQLVQASDISDRELAVARQQKAPVEQYWYSRPRWIWAPLPADPEESNRIVASAVQGGEDVTSMPRYFQPWRQGVEALRKQLKRVDDLGYLSLAQKKFVKERMQEAHMATDELDAIPLVGRDAPLVAIFDPASLQLRALYRVH